MTYQLPPATPEAVERAEELGRERWDSFVNSLQVNYDNMFLRQCSKCGQQKAKNEFNKDLRLKSGRRSECMECEYARKKAKRQLKTKVCRGCGGRRHKRFYHKSKQHPDGLRARCADWMKSGARVRRAMRRI